MGTQARVYAWRVLPLVGLGIRALTEGETDSEFAGAYRDAAELTAALRDNPPDAQVVIVAAFPGGFDPPLVRFDELRPTAGRLGVIALLPAAADEALMVRGLRTEVNGYVLESASPDVTLAAVRTVASGKSYLDPQIAQVALAELRRNTFVPESTRTDGSLTERERMVVQLAADGLTNVEIAGQVGLAEKTIRNLWSGLFDKLGMDDRTQVVLWAIRTGQAVLH